MKLSQLPMVGWTHWCSSSQDSWYWIRHGGNCWNWCGKQAGLTPALVCDRFEDAKHYCWYFHCFLLRDDINLNVISLEFSQTKIVRICVTTLGAVTYPSGTVWSQGDCDVHPCHQGECSDQRREEHRGHLQRWWSWEVCDWQTVPVLARYEWKELEQTEDCSENRQFRRRLAWILHCGLWWTTGTLLISCQQLLRLQVRHHKVQGPVHGVPWTSSRTKEERKKPQKMLGLRLTLNKKPRKLMMGHRQRT